MRRKLFTAVSALSLLLCVATGVLWVRSYFVAEYVALAKARNVGEWDLQRAMSFQSGRGGVAVEFMSDTTDHFMGLPPYSYGRSTSPPQYPHSGPGYKVKWGFEWRHFTRRMSADGHPGVYFWSLVLPIWCFVPVLAILPAVSLRRGVVRRKELLRGHCPKCRYDLTGNASGRCPECGTAVVGNNKVVA